MKKFLFLLAFVSTFAFAEASFDQVQGLIAQQNYAAAAAGLEQIIQNHPKSAKAFYSMAQAQAGLGNLEKAQKALNIAQGLDPTLSFASSSQVQSLREAITPQAAKIESVESHFWRNFFAAILMLGFAVGLWMYVSRKKGDAEEGSGYASTPKPTPPTDSPSDKAYMKERGLDKEPVIVTKPKAEKTTTTTTASRPAPAPTYVAPAPQPVYSAPQPTHTTTVVNQSNDGLLTGMLIGNMLSHHDHHDRVIEREVVREVPSKSYESSSSRSSSWDSDSSSSSWDSDSSSSKRSSSWDSDSSSSSSSWSSSDSSSSSWDSSSSSSDSSW